MLRAYVLCSMDCSVGYVPHSVTSIVMWVAGCIVYTLDLLSISLGLLFDAYLSGLIGILYCYLFLEYGVINISFLF